ncbi:MAG: hypothetical protein CTY31_02295 [Hyphomicrobium sp.]|nr:MAG: hypothetical protein CTY39_12205 [Hyphomicrobium sp.]PPD01606.1 MAG: hypothetical protein CTY31_02295 [Hyphomicrobium sp.]
MIRLYLNGGFGNQLFQYATARALSLKHKTKLEIDLRFYDLSVHNTSKAPWIKDLSIVGSFKTYNNTWPSPHSRLRRGFEKIFFDRLRHVHIEPDLGFHEQVLALGRNCVLIGLFQSYRYFDSIWPTMAREFDISNFSDRAWLSDCARDGRAWAAMHVRRGDYVGDDRFEMRSPEIYYTSAMRRLRNADPDTRFVVFSDNIEWCRRQHWLDGCEFYSRSFPSHPAADMATMAQATHNVIANSSYSWWSAWLGQRPGKVVVMPAVWVDQRRTIDIDLAPAGWTVLS